MPDKVAYRTSSEITALGTWSGKATYQPLGYNLPDLVPHGHQLAVIAEIEKFLRGVSSVPIAEGAIKIVRGADQCKVCESLWKIPKCLALRASLFCKQPEVIGVSQHALEDQTGLI